MCRSLFIRFWILCFSSKIKVRINDLRRKSVLPENLLGYFFKNCSLIVKLVKYKLPSLILFTIHYYLHTFCSHVTFFINGIRFWLLKENKKIATKIKPSTDNEFTPHTSAFRRCVMELIGLVTLSRSVSFLYYYSSSSPDSNSPDSSSEHPG